MTTRRAIRALALLLAASATLAFLVWRRSHPVVGLRATAESLGVGLAWIVVLIATGIWRGKATPSDDPITYFNSAWNPEAVDGAGLYLGWLVHARLLSREWSGDGDAQGCARRQITGPELLETWGEKIVSEMLDAEGNAFTLDYFAASDDYWDDYEEVLGDSATASEKDPWDSFAAIKERIDARFEAWKKQSSAG